MKITAAMLRKHGACKYQVKIFCKEWPNGAVVNEKNALRAVELELDVGWLATNLLSGAAWVSYRKARDAAWAKHRKAEVAAWAKRRAAGDAAMGVSSYWFDLKASGAKRCKAVALAFVEAVKKMEKKRG